MAAYAAIGLQAIKPLIDNSDTIWEKGKERVQKYRRRSMRVYDDEPSSRPRGGQYTGGAADSYYYDNPRTRSAGDYYTDYDSDEDHYYRRRARGRSQNRKSDARSLNDGYDSEASIPPNNRRAQSTRSANSGTGQRGGGTHFFNEDSSDVMDSEEDEKQERKKRRGELLTGGIAAVATLHAAANVYGSMQARQLREKQLADGIITKDQAKRQRYKNHMQDAASIGLAALSIKGAYAKWQGAHSKHKDYKHHRRERQERHQKRLEKGISRDNREESRPPTGRGLPAPEPYDETDGYGAGAVARRPAYDRTYSRSLNDLPPPPRDRDYDRVPRHQDRGAGRKQRDGYYNNYYDAGDGGYEGYDGGHV